MRILVTGGAGFIGSHLVDALLDRGDEVWALDNLSTGGVGNLEHRLGEPRFHLRVDSILDAAVVDGLVAQVDTVYHLAAAVGVKYIVNDPLGSIRTNVSGTEHVLESAYRHWKRVVIASSSEIYGKSRGEPLKETDDRVLGPTAINRWSYAAAKAIDEHFAYAYHQQGLPVSVVRFFNCYGPRLHELGYGSVIANFTRQALAGEPLTVHGDGTQTRCFTYVSDTVRGTLLAGEHPEALGEAFNIGSENEISIAELAELVREIVGGDSEIVRMPYRDYYGHSYEDTPRRRPDTRKSRERLGFSAEIGLRQGLSQTIAWCRENYAAARARTAGQ